MGFGHGFVKLSISESEVADGRQTLGKRLKSAF